MTKKDFKQNLMRVLKTIGVLLVLFIFGHGIVAIAHLYIEVFFTVLALLAVWLLGAFSYFAFDEIGKL